MPFGEMFAGGPMRFVILLVCVIAIGAVVGLALPVSGSSALPANVALAEADQGHHLLDYSRVVHAYREDVDEALHDGLRGAIRQAGQQASDADELSLAGDSDRAVRLTQTTAQGGRLTIAYRVQSQGDEALVTARASVALVPGKGVLKYAPTALTDGVDWGKYAPVDQIRANIDTLFGQVEDVARRRRAARDAETQFRQAQAMRQGVAL
jgi:hypothetical protein